MAGHVAMLSKQTSTCLHSYVTSTGTFVRFEESKLDLQTLVSLQGNDLLFNGRKKLGEWFADDPVLGWEVFLGRYEYQCHDLYNQSK